MFRKLSLFISAIIIITSCEKEQKSTPVSDLIASGIGYDKIKIQFTHPQNGGKDSYEFQLERKLFSATDAEYVTVKVIDGRYRTSTTSPYEYTYVDTGLATGTNYSYKVTAFINVNNITRKAAINNPTDSAMTWPIAALPSITIGTQVWANSNLTVSTYLNGDAIPKITNLNDWKATRSGAWCYFNFDDANDKYGKIYNQYAVDDPRGLAPAGWRIPTSNDYYALRDQLGGKNPAGAKLKSTTGWKSTTISGAAGTNESKWNGLPGYRMTLSAADVAAIDQYGYFWTSTDSTFLGASSRNSMFLYYGTGEMYMGTDTSKNFGHYVRCIRK